MNQSINLGGLGSSIGKFFGRYHLLLFFIATSAGLGFSLVTVISIVSTPDAGMTPVTPTSTTFDKSTMDRLDTLQSADTNAPLELPKNERINPLVDN